MRFLAFAAPGLTWVGRIPDSGLRGREGDAGLSRQREGGFFPSQTFQTGNSQFQMGSKRA